MNKGFNKIFRYKRLVAQAMLLEGWHTIHLIPQISVAILNRDMVVAIGLEWITSTVNLGIARKKWIEVEQDRHNKILEQASKLGITFRQYELRWRGW